MFTKQMLPSPAFSMMTHAVSPGFKELVEVHLSDEEVDRLGGRPPVRAGQDLNGTALISLPDDAVSVNAGIVHFQHPRPCASEFTYRSPGKTGGHEPEQRDERREYQHPDRFFFTEFQFHCLLDSGRTRNKPSGTSRKAISFCPAVFMRCRRFCRAWQKTSVLS